jgi:hypothetical protein
MSRMGRDGIRFCATAFRKASSGSGDPATFDEELVPAARPPVRHSMHSPPSSWCPHAICREGRRRADAWSVPLSIDEDVSAGQVVVALEHSKPFGADVTKLRSKEKVLWTLRTGVDRGASPVSAESSLLSTRVQAQSQPESSLSRNCRSGSGQALPILDVLDGGGVGDRDSTPVRGCRQYSR